MTNKELCPKEKVIFTYWSKDKLKFKALGRIGEYTVGVETEFTPDIPYVSTRTDRDIFHRIENMVISVSNSLFIYEKYGIENDGSETFTAQVQKLWEDKNHALIQPEYTTEEFTGDEYFN